MLKAPLPIEYCVPSNLESAWSCPTCQSRLKGRALHDPYYCGVVCEQGHRSQFPYRIYESSCDVVSQLPAIGSTETGLWLLRG